MSKMKYKIALAAAAVLLLGGVIYIYFAHYARLNRMRRRR